MKNNNKKIGFSGISDLFSEFHENISDQLNNKESSEILDKESEIKETAKNNEYIIFIIISIIILLINNGEELKNYIKNINILNTHNISNNDSNNIENTTKKQINKLYVEGEINYKKFLQLLYGNLTYKNGIYDQPAIWNNINPNFSNYTSGYVFIAYEEKYLEEGKEKYIIVTQTLDKQMPQCHACIPVIGGAVFVKDNDKWVLESENKYIAITGKWGWMVFPDNVYKNNPIKMIKIEPKKWALMYKMNDIHQGYENIWIQLIIPYKNTIINALPGFWLEGATPGACPDNPLAETKQDIRLFYSTNQLSDYYNITLVKYVNKGSCDNIKPTKISERFIFENGHYRKQ